MDIYSILKYTNKYDHPLENAELFKSIEKGLVAVFYVSFNGIS